MYKIRQSKSYYNFKKKYLTDILSEVHQQRTHDKTLGRDCKVVWGNLRIVQLIVLFLRQIVLPEQHIVPFVQPIVWLVQPIVQLTVVLNRFRSFLGAVGRNSEYLDGNVGVNRVAFRPRPLRFAKLLTADYLTETADVIQRKNLKCSIYLSMVNEALTESFFKC